MGSIIKHPVYRLKKETNLFGFGDRIGDVPLCNMGLKAHQDQIFKDFGVMVQDIDHEDKIRDDCYFIFHNDLFFTRQFIQKIFDKATGERSLAFCFDENTFNERYLLEVGEGGKRLIPEVYFKVRKEECRHEVERCLITQEVHDYFLRIPSQIIRNSIWHYDQCDTFAGKVYTPFHLLQLNLALNFSRMVKLNKYCPKWIKEKYVKRGSRLFNWSLRSLNKIHRSARIHPTAVIEGSVIGADVEVGANSVVKGCIIGEGTTIEDCVVCNYSVLGKNNYLSSTNFVNLCMTYDDVYLIHGPYQFSVFGKNVAAMAVINCDFRLDQKGIKINSPSGVIDSGQTLLGIAYGHHSVVGGGNIIAPGRIVPPGYKQVPPDFIITEFKD